MGWQEKVFRGFRLYAVTDLKKYDPAILNKIEAAYKNGTDIVQLRAKTLSFAEKIWLGKAIRKIAEKHKKLYFVNDSLELAYLTDAHGLHVGQDDMPPKTVRVISKKLGRKFLLGLSTHSEKQAKAAQNEPVDYFAVGPVFATPTKPSYGSVGLKLVSQVSEFAVKPWVTIGGIDETNAARVLECGAKRIAVVRAIFAVKDPGKASRKLAALVKG